MCGRFYVDPNDISDDELIRLLNREQERSETSSRITLGEIHPGNSVAVIALNRAGHTSAFVMQWGYHFYQRLLINARCETAQDKQVFRESFQVRRCLIPASAYFEWNHQQKTTEKYRFEPRGKQKIYLAGLYRFEEGRPLPVFTILTRNAAPNLACFHDRMPVILLAEHKNLWLAHDQSPQALLNLAFTDLEWQRAI